MRRGRAVKRRASEVVIYLGATLYMFYLTFLSRHCQLCAQIDFLAKTPPLNKGLS